MRTWLVMAALALVSACPRPVVPPAAGTVVVTASDGLGAPCTSADTCRSGTCHDGVCCQRGCDATESCATDRALGTCTVRALGDACGDNAPCGRGTCVDGVCCESPCDGSCMSCVTPGAVGRCMLAEDNTDRRADCAGSCVACFGGLCLPATRGTDPKDMCDGDTVCNDVGACLAPLGGACGADEECASSACVLGRCTDRSSTRLRAQEFSADARDLTITGMARDGAGQPVLLLRQRYNTNNEPNRMHLVSRPLDPGAPLGVATEHVGCAEDEVLYSRFEPPLQAIAVAGSRVFVVVGDQDTDCEPQPGLDRGVHGLWLDETLQPSRRELLFPLDAEHAPLYWMDALHDPVGARLLVFVNHGIDSGAAYPLTVREYSFATGQWSAPREWARSMWMGGQAIMSAGVPRVVVSLADGPGPGRGYDVAVLWPEGDTLEQEVITPGCTLFQPGGTVVPTVSGEALLVSWVCSGDTAYEMQWATFNPSAAPGTRFGPVQGITLQGSIGTLGALADGRAVLVETLEATATTPGAVIISDASAGAVRARQVISTPWGRNQGADAVWALRAGPGLVIAHSLGGPSSEPGLASAFVTILRQ